MLTGCQQGDSECRMQNSECRNAEEAEGGNAEPGTVKYRTVQPRRRDGYDGHEVEKTVHLISGRRLQVDSSSISSCRRGILPHPAATTTRPLSLFHFKVH